MIIKIIAAKPKKPGTSAIIHVGWSKQFDYTSQNSRPKNTRQQSPRQMLEFLHSSIMIIEFKAYIIKYYIFKYQ